MFPEPCACAAEQPVLITATVDTRALPETKFITTIVTFTLYCSKQNKKLKTLQLFRNLSFPHYLT